MEVEGLRPNVPVAAGFSVNKPKIFGMQDGDGDYTTNIWRIAQETVHHPAVFTVAPCDVGDGAKHHRG